MEDSSRPNSTLHVSNLPHHPLLTQSHLSSLFIPFGELTTVTLPKPTLPSDTNIHRGFGYVEFEERADAKEAINNMDGAEIFGRTIKVTWAKERVREEGEVHKGMETAIWEREGYQEQYGQARNEPGGNDANDDGKVEEDPMRQLEELDVAGPRFKSSH